MELEPVQSIVRDDAASAGRRGGVMQQIPHFLKLYFRLFSDRRVSVFAKLVLVAGLAYAVSPLDFLPDVAPILGQIDDLTVLMLACRTFLTMCPPGVVDEHTAAIVGATVRTASGS